MQLAAFHRSITLFSLALAGSLAAVASIAVGPTPALRPLATKPLSASLADNAMQFFKNRDFGGSMFQISDVTGKQAWRAHRFQEGQEDNFSSLRWNLPRGVVVSLHERDDGLGRTVYVFGAGEIPQTKPWKLNDRLSSWAWNYVGGVTNPPKTLADAQVPRPKYGKECEPITADSIHLFKNRECKGTMTAMEQITRQPMGAFKELPATGTSSMKWNLPDGVVVVFSNSGSGESQQVAIWGRGMFESFHQWDMNDRVRQWAWYSLGDEPAAAPSPNQPSESGL